jgi:hypothetical protein
MKTILIAALAFGTVAEAAAQQPNIFTSQDALEACVLSQKNEPQNIGMPDEIIVRYCACTTTNMANTLTQSDLGVMSGKAYTDYPADIRAKIYNAGMACLGEIRGKCVRDTSGRLTCNQ